MSCSHATVHPCHVWFSWQLWSPLSLAPAFWLWPPIRRLARMVWMFQDLRHPQNDQLHKSGKNAAVCFTFKSHYYWGDCPHLRKWSLKAIKWLAYDHLADGLQPRACLTLGLLVPHAQERASGSRAGGRRWGGGTEQTQSRPALASPPPLSLFPFRKGLSRHWLPFPAQTPDPSAT